MTAGAGMTRSWRYGIARPLYRARCQMKVAPRSGATGLPVSSRHAGRHGMLPCRGEPPGTTNLSQVSLKTRATPVAPERRVFLGRFAGAAAFDDAAEGLPDSLRAHL